MTFFQNTSIKYKQTLIIMLISGISLFAACAAVIVYEVVNFRGELVGSTTSMAEVIGNNSTAALDFGDIKSAEEALSALRVEPNVIAACIFARDGQIFATYQRDDQMRPIVFPKLNPDSAGFVNRELQVFRSIKQSGETVGTVYIVSNLNELSDRLKNLSLLLFLAFGGSFILALLLSHRLQRFITEPILRLTNVVQEIARKQTYSLRVEKHGDDEVGQLIDQFNEMLGQIQERDANLERRVAERTTESQRENSERKRAEDALRESQALYYSLVEQLPAGIFRKDAEGRYVLVNTWFCNLRGKSPNEILGKTSAELSLSETERQNEVHLLNRGTEDHKKIMQTGTPMEVEERYIRLDGEVRLLQVIKSPVFGPDGKVIGSQGILMDITGRRCAEDALREQQALYHSLVEHLPAGVFRKDYGGRFVFVNSFFCGLKGRTPEEILGRTPQELAAYEATLPNTDADAIEGNVQRAMAIQGADHHQMMLKNGKSIEIEEAYPRPDGAMQYFQSMKSPVFAANKKIIGTQGILFDITARKQAEAMLAYERDLLQALMDSSPDLIYFKDRQSRFIKCSKALIERYGAKSMDEVVGKSDFDFYSDEHARPLFEDEQKIIRTGLPLVGKIEKDSLKNNQEFWALTNKVPLRDNKGEIIGTFGISKDITAIKETEAKLNEIHKQLVDASHQAGMAEVATSVLHNVGNVLNSVNVSSSLISEKVRNSKVANIAKAITLIREHENDLGTFLTADPKGKQLPGYLGNLAAHLTQEQQEILTEVGSLVTNIVHIKEIVSMQQGYAKSSGVLESLKISDLVEDALRMNMAAMSRHHVNIVREFAELPPILTEKHKVLQILVNLIRNAKYACDESGRDDKQITLRIANGEGRVKISVIDNGIGIPSENLTRIFNHGFTTRKDGHGFGLHSGALAAKEMGGALIVFSEGPNRGAMFTLELPTNRQQKIL